MTHASPSGWAEVRVGEACRLVNGRAFKPQDWTSNGLPIVRIQNLNNRTAAFNRFAGRVEDKFLIEDGELLFAWSGTPGTSFGAHIWDRGKAILNQHIFRVLDYEVLFDKAFLRYAINEQLEHLIGQAHGGAGLAHVTKPKFEATELCLPPLNEQRRIVAKLEALQARSRRAREALDAVPPLLEKLRQSILAAAFRGDLTKEWRAKHPDVEPASELLKRIRIERRKKWEEAELAKLKAKGKPPTDDRWKEKYKEPEPVDASGLPELPDRWCWASIAEIADVGTGATPKRGNDRYYSGGTVAWVTSGALNRDEVTEATEHVTTRAVEETNLTLYPVGTLLLAMYGEGKTRGMVSELRIAATTNQAIAAIVLLGVPAAAHYLVKLFLERNYAEIRRASMGGVQPNLNLEKVRRLAVPICPGAEAVELENRLGALLARSGSLHAIVHTQELHLRLLDRSILGAAFRGELVPQDPNDEPADVMLARLRAAAPAPEPGKRRRRRSEAAE